jgi:Matrixin
LVHLRQPGVRGPDGRSGVLPVGRGWPRGTRVHARDQRAIAGRRVEHRGRADRRVHDWRGTAEQSHPPVRFPLDGRRSASSGWGDNITYLVDHSDGATASGLTNAQTKAAIDRAVDTWQNARALRKVDLIKRGDSGADPDIFDFFFGFGAFGNPFLADIVNAGWLPRAFFEAVFGPGGGRGVLAFSVTFIFVDDTDVPTDINGDNFLDAALNEVYYNNTFGQAGTDRANRPWGINVAPPGIDVETVALHENGHSLGIGHFGPPPIAVMDPVYGGIRHLPFAVDHASMAAVWGTWPR